MPNWFKGNIRFRGKPEDIAKFLEKEIVAVATNNDYETLEFPPSFYRDEYSLTVGVPAEVCDDNNLHWSSLYIKGTKRNFIDDDIEVWFNDKDSKGNIIVHCDDFAAAWDIDYEPYKRFSKKYNIDIKIVGYECGAQFGRTLEILQLHEGEETITEVRDYPVQYLDWDWECPFPRMGG